MNKFRFLEWNVYKDAKELLGFILKIIKKIPNEYRYDLGGQVIRAAFSVVLNIAEGSGKISDKDMNRFFNISLGSLNETLAAADILYFNNFISKQEFEWIYKKIDSISCQLGGFKKKLKK